MKSKGIIRRVDELGRIVVPKEMRTSLGIDVGTPLEIHIEGDTIVMKKEHAVCIFCGSEAAECDFRGKRVCADCLNELKA